MSRRSEDLCSKELHRLYRSLMGTVAFLPLTYIGAMVTIFALAAVMPRETKRPTRESRQAEPSWYPYLRISFLDFAFRKEEQSGRCTRRTENLLCLKKGPDLNRVDDGVPPA